MILMYLISNSKFKVRDKKIIDYFKNYNNTYIHKIIVFDFSVTSEMMAMPLVCQNVSLHIILLKPFLNLGLHTFLHMPCHAIAS